MPSERRWIILAQDGRHVTLGRALVPKALCKLSRAAPDGGRHWPYAALFFGGHTRVLGQG